jgi:hypothetical protein
MPRVHERLANPTGMRACQPGLVLTFGATASNVVSLGPSASNVATLGARASNVATRGPRVESMVDRDCWRLCSRADTCGTTSQKQVLELDVF